MALVEWRGKLWPAALFESDPTGPYVKPKCGICGDSGLVREQIDEERHDVMMACWNCRKYCKACDKYMPKDHVHEETTTQA